MITIDIHMQILSPASKLVSTAAQIPSIYGPRDPKARDYISHGSLSCRLHLHQRLTYSDIADAGEYASITPTSIRLDLTVTLSHATRECGNYLILTPIWPAGREQAFTIFTIMSHHFGPVAFHRSVLLDFLRLPAVPGIAAAAFELVYCSEINLIPRVPWLA